MQAFLQVKRQVLQAFVACSFTLLRLDKPCLSETKRKTGGANIKQPFLDLSLQRGSKTLSFSLRRDLSTLTGRKKDHRGKREEVVVHITQSYVTCTIILPLSCSCRETISASPPGLLPNHISAACTLFCNTQKKPTNIHTNKQKYCCSTKITFMQPVHSPSEPDQQLQIIFPTNIYRHVHATG